MIEFPRLLLVDDHHLLLDSLRMSLSASFDIVGVASNAAEALSACARLRPDLVLLDLSLPDRNGLEVIAELRNRFRDIRILVVTMHVERIMADAALQTGAHGFIPKDAGMDELRTAIRSVLSGEIYRSPRVPERRTPGFKPDLRLGLGKLSVRQRRILRLLADGRSTARIAKQLHVTPSTISFHRQRIRKLLGLKSEWDLLRYALLARLADKPEPPKPAAPSQA